MIMYVLGANSTTVYAYLEDFAASVIKIRWYFYKSETDVFPIELSSTAVIEKSSSRIERIDGIPEGYYHHVKVIVYYDKIVNNGNNWEEHTDLYDFTIDSNRGMSANFLSSGEIEVSFFGFDSNHQGQRGVYFYLNGVDEYNCLNAKEPIILDAGSTEYKIFIDAKNKQQYGNNVIIAKIELTNTEFIYFATEFDIPYPGEVEKNPKITKYYVRYNREEDKIEYHYKISNINPNNHMFALTINGQTMKGQREANIVVDKEEYPPYVGIYEVNNDEKNMLGTGEYSWKITAISYTDHRGKKSYESELSGTIKISAPGTTGATWIRNKQVNLGTNKNGICSYYPQISATDFQMFCDDVQEKFKIEKEEMDKFKENIRSGEQMKKEFFEFLLDCMGAKDEKKQLNNQSVMYNINDNFDCFLLLENAYKKYNYGEKGD